MSYSFTVRKVDDGLVVENGENAARHIPDGAVFTVNGHEPAEGTSSVANLGISLAVAGEHRGAVTSSAQTKR